MVFVCLNSPNGTKLKDLIKKNKDELEKNNDNQLNTKQQFIYQLTTCTLMRTRQRREEIV